MKNAERYILSQWVKIETGIQCCALLKYYYIPFCEHGETII